MEYLNNKGQLKIFRKSKSVKYFVSIESRTNNNHLFNNHLTTSEMLYLKAKELIILFTKVKLILKL